MQKTKILFFGSGNFAIPVLERLFDYDLVEVTGVVTQPDKVAGRKKALRPTPLKAELQESTESFKFFQPGNISKDYERIVRETTPDLIVVADYGQILPGQLLDLPQYLSLNVHASLLPKLRGAAPIQAAILEGFDKTGISIMQMTPGLDDGPVLKQAELTINPEENAIKLEKRLAALGAQTLVETLPDWIRGELSPKAQKHVEATYAPKDLIDKLSAEITKKTPVMDIDRMVRAFVRWPVAWMRISYEGHEKRVKIYSVTLTPTEQQTSGSGKLVREGKDLILKMKDGKVRLDELQLEGKKRDTGKNYLFLAGKARII
ncbi:MAG: methionyl-tRNA formyltransferase [Candidatus Dojkabacteria bacterium]